MARNWTWGHCGEVGNSICASDNVKTRVLVPHKYRELYFNLKCVDKTYNYEVTLANNLSTKAQNILFIEIVFVILCMQTSFLYAVSINTKMINLWHRNWLYSYILQRERYQFLWFVILYKIEVSEPRLLECRPTCVWKKSKSIGSFDFL